MFRRWFGGSSTDRLYTRGIEFFHRGELTAAVEAFERSLEEGGDADHPTTALAQFYMAEAHGRLGRLALASGAYANALEEFEWALEHQPNFPDLHFCSGLASYQLGRPHDALRSARRALEYNTRYLEAEALVSLCHLELSEELLAEQSLGRCVEFAAGRDEPLARLVASGKRFAPRELTEMLLESPRRRERIERATSLLEQGFWEEARDAFAQLVAQHPGYPDLRVNLAKCHYRLAESDAAAEQLREALYIRPGLAQANTLMGVLYLREHAVKEARASFHRAMESDARSTFARYGFAASALLADDLEHAMSLADSLVREHPESAAVLRLACYCHSLRREEEPALEALSRWAALTEDDAIAALDQIVIALEFGRIDLARAWLGRLPDGAADAATASARARVAAASGDPNGALELLRLAREHLGDQQALILESAETAARLQEWPTVADLSRALADQNARARTLLARALRKDGREREAIRLLSEPARSSLESEMEKLLALRGDGECDGAEAVHAALMGVVPLDLRVRAQEIARWCEPFEHTARAVETAH